MPEDITGLQIVGYHNWISSPLLVPCICVMTGKNYGVILLPEGLIESIPEFYALLQVTLYPMKLALQISGTIWSY